MSSSSTTTSVFQREQASYKGNYQIFVQKEKNYLQQYSHVYLKRLLALRPRLHEILSSSERLQQDGGQPITKIADKVISLQVGEFVGVIGTIYKDQKLKPNVLDEFSNDFALQSREKLENYCSEDDTLLLEDESGRCTLIGQDAEEWKLQVASLVSGVVVGCAGKLNEAGAFVVERIYFPGDFMSPLPPRNPTTNGKSRYLLLTSGIYAGNIANSHSLALQLLLDYVAGHLDPATGSSIARMVVAGGNVCPPKLKEAFKDSTLDAKLSIDAQEGLVDSIRAADRFFAELAACVPVDLMPGESDPCNMSLPQQPLHHCLFPNAARLSASTFRCVTNPYSFVLDDDLQVLCHSGQPVTDALSYMSPGSQPIDFLIRCILKFRHLAPTAPDTLACYPFHDRDPFVIEREDVRLAFCGNVAEYATRFDSGTRFICVPNFRSTKQVVLVDLSSPELEPSVISFDVHI